MNSKLVTDLIKHHIKGRHSRIFWKKIKTSGTKFSSAFDTTCQFRPISTTTATNSSADRLEKAPKNGNLKPQHAPNTVPVPDFLDTKTIYKSKTFGELMRAFVVFSLCSSNFLVNNQLQILAWTQKLLGRRLFRRMMRMTIYGQFLAGEQEDEVLSVAKKNSEAGLFPMYAYTASEVHGDAKSSAGFFSMDDIYTNNFNTLQDCIVMTSKSKDLSDMVPMFATKLTFLASAETLTSLSSVLAQQKSVVADILNSKDAQKAKEFKEYIITILIKSQKQYSEVGMILPNNIKNEMYVPSLVTSLPIALTLNQSPELQSFVKGNEALHCLSAEEVKCVVDIWTKMDNLTKFSHDENVSFIWDAEQSYLQQAIECICLDAMRKYNVKKPIVHSTYQCYLKRTYDNMLHDIDLSNREGFSLGLKVVRGAYMDEERKRASTLGYEYPINPTYDATTAMYEKVATFLIELLRDCDNPQKYHVTFATHNEQTVKFILDCVNDLGYSFTGKNLAFAQLQGMRDHITFALGQANIPAAKLICYGIVEEGVAWLSRRMVENRSGSPTADLERNLINSEIRRRYFKK